MGSANSRTGGAVGGIRARFEKFETPQKKQAATAETPAVADVRRPSSDNEKLLDDSQKLVKDLQAQLTDLEKVRASDRKELTEKIQESQKQLQKEKKDLLERNVQVKYL